MPDTLFQGIFQIPAGIVGFHLFGSVPEPFTLYRDISALPAGHTQRVDAAGPHEPVPFTKLAAILAEGASHPVPTGELRERLRVWWSANPEDPSRIIGATSGLIASVSRSSASPISINSSALMYNLQSSERINVGAWQKGETHQTRKGIQWYFGIKAHSGVDSRSKLIHAVWPRRLMSATARFCPICCTGNSRIAVSGQ